MEDIKIEELYNNLLLYLNDLQNIDFIWFQEMKEDCFLDNYFKFYFFKQGINTYYPMCNFTGQNTEKPEIITIWDNFKNELINVIPITDHPQRPSEYLLDLIWIDKNGHMPFCMEMEKVKNLNKIVYDFKKLLFINSNLKVMLFHGHCFMNDIKEIVSGIPLSTDGKYLLISYDIVTNKIDSDISKKSISIRAKLSYNGHNKDLKDGTFFFFKVNGSISLLSPIAIH